MTNEMKDAHVYRVCAGKERRWDVFEEPAREPLASFDDKAAALNYAMCLARGRGAWHLLLRPATGAPIGAAPITAATLEPLERRNTHY